MSLSKDSLPIGAVGSGGRSPGTGAGRGAGPVGGSGGGASNGSTRAVGKGTTPSYDIKPTSGKDKLIPPKAKYDTRYARQVEGFIKDRKASSAKPIANKKKSALKQALGALAVGGTVSVASKPENKVKKFSSGMNLDKAQSIRKKIAADDNASTRSAYKKNRAEFEKKMNYENSTQRIRDEKKKKKSGTIPSAPTY
jgi:hypothetical protein